MATLLGESLFEVSGQGPAPNKDFFQFSVTKTEVIWRWWKISLRSDGRNTKPGELRESHNDYLDDSRLQSQVSVVFGPRILQYSQALCQGHYDYLERLPDPLLLHILAHLELEDVARLGHTSHRFRKLCRSEEFWEQAVRGHCGSVSAEVEALALELGWKSVFFTSKLQLQKQISRRRKRSHKLLCTDPERYDVDTMVERSEDPESHTAESEEAMSNDSNYDVAVEQNTGLLNATISGDDIGLLDTVKVCVHGVIFLTPFFLIYLIVVTVCHTAVRFVLLCQHCACVTSFNAVGTVLHGLSALHVPISRLTCWVLFDFQVALGHGMGITLMALNTCLSILRPLHYPILVRRIRSSVMTLAWFVALLNPVLFTVLACAQSSMWWSWTPCAPPGWRVPRLGSAAWRWWRSWYCSSTWRAAGRGISHAPTAPS